MTGSRGLDPLICNLCGSSWFRQAAFVSTHPAQGQASLVAVCLCGAVAPPMPSGVRPGTVEPALNRLVHDWEAKQIARQSTPDIRILAEAAVGPALAGDIARLERSLELLAWRLLAASSRARPKPPRRLAATHGLDMLALELQRAGLLNFRQARRAVQAIRDGWRDAIARGESVETPWGEVSVQKGRSGRRRVVWHSATPPCVASNTGSAHAIESMPPNPNPTSTAECPRCGSRWFAREDFRQYANPFYRASFAASMHEKILSELQVELKGRHLKPRRKTRPRTQPS